MRILVVGAQLQGVELTLLSKFAGYHVTVLDRRPNSLASELADSFICLDVKDLEASRLNNFDLIFPAFEDPASLDVLYQKAAEVGASLL